MTSKQIRNPEATREALLEAAEAVFLEKGFGNTSLSDIARRADITKSLIHHYFNSKEGLWQEIKTRRFMVYADRQLEIIQDAEPSVELLRASLVFYFDFLKRNPQIVRILAWIFLENDNYDCMQKDKELIDIGLQKVKQAQAAGEIRDDVDARFLLFVFIGLCQHWFQDKEHFIADFGTDGLPEKLDDGYLEAIIKIFFEGILPRKR